MLKLLVCRGGGDEETITVSDIGGKMVSGVDTEIQMDIGSRHTLPSDGQRCGFRQWLRGRWE